MTTQGQQIDFGDQAFFSLLMGKKKEPPKNSVPLLFIGLGGTGAQVLRRLKWEAHWLGMTDLVRFLVVDTDINYKDPEDHYPGFEDNEFVLLPVDGVRTVISHPDRHPKLKKRFALSDEHIMGRMQDAAGVHIDGAGQYRPYGALRFITSYKLFDLALNDAITYLNGKWNDIGSHNRQFHTIVVSSVCGGTGAGILVDVATALWNKLKDQNNPKTFAFLALPSVYDSVAAGKPKQDYFTRFRANSYACLQELDYFRSGKAALDGFQLSKDYESPNTDIFTSVNLIGRIDQSGRELKDEKAVFDTIALFLSAFLGQHAIKKALSEMCNDSRFVDEKYLKRRTYVASIGAGALSIPIKALLRYCTFNTADELVRSLIIGSDNPAATNLEVTKWLSTTQIEGSPKKDADKLVENILGSRDVGFQSTKYTSRLYAGTNKRGRSYRPDKQFTLAFDRSVSEWRGKLFPELKRRINRAAKKQTKILTQQLADRIPILLTERLAPVSEESNPSSGVGIQSVLAFLSQLKEHFDSTVEFLTVASTNRSLQGEKALEEAQKRITPLRGFFGRMGTDEARQQAVISKFEEGVNSQISGETMIEAKVVLQNLSIYCGEQIGSIRKLLDVWQNVVSQLSKLSASSRVDDERIPYGTSRAELSAMTMEDIRIFRQENTLKPGLFFETIQKATKQKNAAWLLSSIENTQNAFKAVIYACGSHYYDRLQELNLLDMMHQAHSSKSKYKEILSRFEAVLTGCQPQWVASTPELDIELIDSLAIPRPPSDKKPAVRFIEQFIEERKSSIHGVSGLTATPRVFVHNERDRIFVLRRVSGAMCYYVRGWKDCRDEFQKNKKNYGNQDSYTVPPEVINNLPPMTPVDSSDGDRAWAIAMAYGWIAKRGRFYYFNLVRNETRGRWEVPLCSFEDSIAFHNKNLRDDLGALGYLRSKRKIFFRLDKPSSAGPKLGKGRGRADASKDFKSSDAAVNLVLQAFRDVIDEAGKDAVATDLMRYVQIVSEYSRTTPQLQTLKKQVIDILEREVEILHT